MDIVAEGFEGYAEFLSWQSDQRHYESCQGGTLPTPRVIREKAAVIRAGWSRAEERSRRGLTKESSVRYTIPEASTANLQ